MSIARSPSEEKPIEYSRKWYILVRRRWELLRAPAGLQQKTRQLEAVLYVQDWLLCATTTTINRLSIYDYYDCDYQSDHFDIQREDIAITQNGEAMELRISQMALITPGTGVASQVWELLEQKFKNTVS